MVCNPWSQNNWCCFVTDDTQSVTAVWKTGNQKSIPKAIMTGMLPWLGNQSLHVYISATFKPLCLGTRPLFGTSFHPTWMYWPFTALGTRLYLCKFRVQSSHNVIELTSSTRYDALIYARALTDRSPGTHNLHLVEDADHNFTGVCPCNVCLPRVF